MAKWLISTEFLSHIDQNSYNSSHYKIQKYLFYGSCVVTHTLEVTQSVMLWLCDDSSVECELVAIYAIDYGFKGMIW